MISDKLLKARKYDEENRDKILPEERPGFHLTGNVGWINDPNGFSYYKGKYHMFYQAYPYGNHWGPMHWGHAVSSDLLTWERLPYVMAPDREYDNFGVFSGSGLELADGRHLLMYTGVHEEPVGESDDPLDMFGRGTITQTQCLAFGDGIDYEKYEQNPVILPESLPEGSSSVDFRDPKIWQEEDGTFYAVAASVAADGNGQIALYKAEDLSRWEFCTILARSSKKLGGIWECPDFFMVDGKYALCVSPMEMMPDNKGFHIGHCTLAVIGDFNKETYEFTPEHYQPMDWGIDYYAPQSSVMTDGRRVNMAWMQACSNSRFVPAGKKYFGQLALPRELHIADGRLVQNPIRELENYRGEKVEYQKVSVTEEELRLEGISGRMVDMTVTVPRDEALKEFCLKAAQNDTYYTTVTFDREKNTLCMDRSFGGYAFDIVHRREFPILQQEGDLKMRIILDRFSMEIFLNDGEQTAAMSMFTEQEADGISFSAKGQVRIDVEKYDLLFEAAE